MKYLITERQLKLIKEQDEILELDFDFFNKNWNALQKFLERRGNPPYIITGDLDLRDTDIETLGNLQSVGGYLDLIGSSIKSLGNLQSVGDYLDLRNTNVKSLGDLKTVGRNLFLTNTKIKSLGNLQFVGGGLHLRNVPLLNATTKEEIRSQVEVGGSIYF